MQEYECVVLVPITVKVRAGSLGEMLTKAIDDAQRKVLGPKPEMFHSRVLTSQPK
jgi:hypothetical protein